MGSCPNFYGNIPATSQVFDDGDRALSRTILGYVGNFTRTGDPNGEGLPPWTSDEESKTVLELGDSVGMTDEKHLALYAIMDRMEGWE